MSQQQHPSLNHTDALLEPQQCALATELANASADPLGPALAALQFVLKEVPKLCSVEDAELILG